MDTRTQLARLLCEKSYREGDFTLASGRKSDYYFDCRVTALSSEGSYLIGTLFFDMIKDMDLKGVAGMTMGADPLVTAVTFASWLAKKPLDGLLVRKTPKDHGLGQSVEGLANFQKGDRVAVLDDVITTGGSLLKACDRVREAGLDIACIACILDRGEGGREIIRERTGLELSAIFTRRELVDLGKN